MLQLVHMLTCFRKSSLSELNTSYVQLTWIVRFDERTQLHEMWCDCTGMNLRPGGGCRKFEPVHL